MKKIYTFICNHIQFIEFILKNVLKNITSIYGVIGIFFCFSPLHTLFPEWIGSREKIFLGVLFLIILFGVSTIVEVFWFFCLTNCIVYEKIKDSNHIYVHYGDVFDKKIVGKKNGTRNIVIPVNCCFDTKIDDVQIAEDSLQYKAIKLMNAKGLTEDEIQSKIWKSLEGKPYEELSQNDKPRGNCRRYQEGTIAVVNGGNGIRFLFIALAKFDSDLHSISPSKEDFFQTFAKMLENISVNSEGYPFVLPVVGSGLSNTELSEQDLLDFLMKSLKLYRNSFNTDVHVVVYHKKKKLISITSA